jgi:NTE family protein
MLFKSLSFLLLSCIFFSAVPILTAQENPVVVKKRPTVGLVLSGGGARGLAHIGVLKVLEENRIPVDFVGGASMGALVGALYSMGRTPAEIEAFVAGMNWDQYVQSTAAFDNLSFRRKEDRRNIPSPIVLKGKANNLKLPNALNSGHEIGLLFDRTTLPYSLISSFAELPIPFRCVGTDMVTGASVELKDGSLPRALRASMSVPGVFAPVEIDGRILSDGGLVNNIPTNIVKDMGADILLVVNIETQLGNRESLDNLLGILAQTINIASADNSRRSLRQADLIIAPELGELSSTDFSKAAEIIELGYRGAQQKAEILKGLSLNEADWQSHLANRRARKLTEDPPTPKYLAVDGDNKKSVEAIDEKLGDKYVGQPLDKDRQDQLSKDLSELVGTGRFASLEFELQKKKNETGLKIITNEPLAKTTKPTRLELGFDVNSVEADNVNFNLIARMTVFDVGRYGAEWRNDLRLGSSTLLATEYYRPIGSSGVFVAPRASYGRSRVNFFSGGSRNSEYVVQSFQIGADIGYSFSLKNEIRAGYTLGYESASRRIGDNVLPKIKGRFSAASVRWNYDGLNNAQVPTKGILTRNSLNYIFDSPDSTTGYAQFESRNMMFQPSGERNVIFGFANAGSTIGSTAPQLQQFALGGPFRLGGYGYDEFRGSNYAQGGFGYLYNPKSFPTFLGGKVYLGAWYEGGSIFENRQTANYRQSGTGGAIIETPLGPVFIGASVNEKGRSRIYFSFGRLFRFSRSDSF